MKRNPFLATTPCLQLVFDPDIFHHNDRKCCAIDYLDSLDHFFFNFLLFFLIFVRHEPFTVGDIPTHTETGVKKNIMNVIRQFIRFFFLSFFLYIFLFFLFLFFFYFFLFIFLFLTCLFFTFLFFCSCSCSFLFFSFLFFSFFSFLFFSFLFFSFLFFLFHFFSFFLKCSFHSSNVR